MEAVISGLDVFPVRLPMRKGFSTSKGTVGDPKIGAPHVYVRVRSDGGEFGWGEARPSPRWGYETFESVVTTILKYLSPAIVGESIYDLVRIRKKMDLEIASGTAIGQPIAKAAVDMALHDLLAKHLGVPLSNLWFARPMSSIPLTYLVDASEPNQAVSMVECAVREGYSGIDLKIGRGLSQDLELIQSVAPYIKGLFFRVDANQAYGIQDAIQLGKRIVQFGVDVLEQPLAAGNLRGHSELRRKLDIPIALDESVYDAMGLIQALHFEACDSVVIKVTKMGGLVGAKRCGEIANEAQIHLLGGGLTESGLGFSASAHLFHYLNITTPVDLNGPIFLAEDPVENGPYVQNGKGFFSIDLGIGCSINVDKMKKWIV